MKRCPRCAEVLSPFGDRCSNCGLVEGDPEADLAFFITDLGPADDEKP